MRARDRQKQSNSPQVSGVPFRSLCLYLALLGAAVSAQAGQSKLIGVWSNDIQNVDCVSGQVTGDPFVGLHTYYSDGNLLQISSTDPAFGSITQGRWSKAGKNTYAARTQGAVFDVNGFYTGYLVIERMITLAKDGQTLEFSARGSRYTADGQFLGTACAVATGVKLPEPTPY